MTICRPSTLPLVVAGLPREIVKLKQFVAWRWEQRPDNNGVSKWTKVPYVTRPDSNGEYRRASTRKPFSWNFAVNAITAQKLGFDGIGFVFGESGDLFGIDLDKCRDPETGTIEKWATQIIEQFRTYAEVSPSGTGVKLIGKGQLPIPANDKRGGRRTGKIEVYQRWRFFTLTGHRVGEEFGCVRDCSDVLPGWFRETFPAKAKAKTPPPTPTNGHHPTVEGDDATILRIASRSKSGQMFDALWRGDISGHGDDHSGADIALCNVLAFYTGPNPSRIDAIFRQSGLYREKWERQDYRESTIDAAIKGQAKFFDWGTRTNGHAINGHTTNGHSQTNGASKLTASNSTTGGEPAFLPTINNCVVTEGDEGQKIVTPIPMAEIIKQIRENTKDWPRMCGGSLFFDHNHKIDWIGKASQFFGLLGQLSGTPAKIVSSPGLHSKEEIHSEWARGATSYQAVEELPHEPPLPGHYYCCDVPPPGDGKALDGLISRFSPETPIDRELILSLFASAFWGGPPGARPLFLITATEGRGAGKSALVSMLSYLLGGMIDLSAREDASVIKQRLLSPDGRTKRLATLDNVKSLRFSWAELESLITIPTISGKMLYVGESARPNSLVWTITLNGASLSTDIAQRVATINLARPTYSPAWGEQTREFIDTHRQQIIGDIIGFLRTDPKPLAKYSRWGAWERDVLSRLSDPEEVQRVIAERQSTADVEEEETEIIEDFFAEQIASLHYGESDRVFIPSQFAARWLNWATNEKHSATSSTRMLKQKIDEGKFERLQFSPSRARGRGFLWIGSNGHSPDSPTHFDLEERLRRKSNREREDSF